MKDIFDNQSFRDVGNETWETSEEKRRTLKAQVDKINEVYEEFLAFYDKVEVKRGEVIWAIKQRQWHRNLQRNC